MDAGSKINFDIKNNPSKLINIFLSRKIYQDRKTYKKDHRRISHNTSTLKLFLAAFLHEEFFIKHRKEYVSFLKTT